MWYCHVHGVMKLCVVSVIVCGCIYGAWVAMIICACRLWEKLVQISVYLNEYKIVYS